MNELTVACSGCQEPVGDPIVAGSWRLCSGCANDLVERYDRERALLRPFALAFLQADTYVARGEAFLDWLARSYQLGYEVNVGGWDN